MALVFIVGLIFYYLLFLRDRKSVLSILLWSLYLSLGIFAEILDLTEGIAPIFSPNYFSVFVLLAGVLFSISGFLRFESENVLKIFEYVRFRSLIENFLILTQFYAIIFFFPFAVSSFVGDINENRLLLTEKMDILSSYGLLNTFAGAASQLFHFSLAFAFSRVLPSDKVKQNPRKAIFLVIASFSYVIYILAYVGRDGVVYWLMTFFLVYIIFRRHLDPRYRRKIFIAALMLGSIASIPFILITISRFFDADQGGFWSLLEYFGAQIQNFSDYSSIDRPVTYGVQNFPMFSNAVCSMMMLDCQSWTEIKDAVFDVYLTQGKAPWLFGTFISDFVGDFGALGGLLFVATFALVCAKACSLSSSHRRVKISGFLLVIFLFLIPYWGVFYFRFSIINGFLIVNLLFIFAVWILQHLRGSQRL